MEKLIWEAGSILIVLLSFTWAIYGTRKKFKQREIISKNISKKAKELEIERKKQAYLKQQAELLKSQLAQKPEGIRTTEKTNKPNEFKYSRKAEPFKPKIIWTDDFVKSLEWKRFEEVCCELLRVEGHNAETTGIGADGGVDIVIKDDNDVIVSVAQCKAFGKKPIGVALIRELLGVMASRNIKKGLFFTTSTFSSDAVEFAKNNGISLVDLKSFVRAVNALNSDRQEWLYKVATKGDFTTPTCPRCDVSMIKRANRFSNTEFWGCSNFPKCRMTMKVRA